MKKSPFSVKSPKLVFTETGVKICGVFVIDATGQQFEGCTPEIPREDAERALVKAWGDVKDEGGRFWKRVKGWFK